MSLLNLLVGRPEKFIVFCDDLSFEQGEVGYKALKTALDFFFIPSTACAPQLGTTLSWPAASMYMTRIPIPMALA